jgi:hypothetical protein
MVRRYAKFDSETLCKSTNLAYQARAPKVTDPQGSRARRCASPDSRQLGC